MQLLSREQFVKLCTEAIIETRNKITIRNQLSGYIKYRQEIKNHYLSQNLRPKIQKTDKNDYQLRHDIIERGGLGNCQEIAQYLLVEIGKLIQANKAKARISIVASKILDHVYLEIKLKLKNEKDYSIWEVDGWDPRIIDISMQLDGVIKNRESLTYGYSVKRLEMVHTDELELNKKRKRDSFFLRSIKKPKLSESKGDETPERELFIKHKDLYADLTIEDAYKTKKLNPNGTIGFLQEVSFWQQLSNDKYRIDNDQYDKEQKNLNN